MKLKVLLAAVLSAAVLICFPVAESYNRDNVVFVTESLNNYALGYMSWGVKHMGLDVLQKKFEQKGNLPEVKVAVIDSGINTSNRYVQNRYTNDGYNFINNTTDFNDDQYHGTMVSGIIADCTSSNVKVLPLKVNDASGRGNMNNVKKAIYYAIEHNADVINLSLSSEDPNRTITVLDDAIADAVSNGLVVVVAAGNQSGDTAYRYPANKENVITITSIDKNDKIADSANTGADVDFALPGVSVLAPYKRLPAMMIDSGTSLAAPHAAAAAALLKTWDKDITQDQVVEVLKQYSVDLGAKGFDNSYGWGMINLSSFDINAAPPEPVTEPTTEPDTEPITEPTTEPTTEPIPDPTTEPITEPTAEPTVEPTTAPVAEPVLIGDVNFDGVIDILDSVLVQRRATDSIDFDEKQAYAADVNDDGVIDILDAMDIQKYSVNMIKEFKKKT